MGPCPDTKGGDGRIAHVWAYGLLDWCVMYHEERAPRRALSSPLCTLSSFKPVLTLAHSMPCCKRALKKMNELIPSESLRVPWSDKFPNVPLAISEPGHPKEPNQGNWGCRWRMGPPQQRQNPSLMQALTHKWAKVKVEAFIGIVKSLTALSSVLLCTMEDLICYVIL